MTVITDSDNTTLTMHQFSENVVFDTPSGYTQDNLECDPQNAYISLDTQSTSIYQAVSDIFGNLPCEGVTFNCNKTQSCELKYINTSYNYQPFFNCQGPFYLQELFELRCIGTCPESPSVAPTPAPSFSPTGETVNPSKAPSFSPSFSPTLSPSTSPSFSPSYSPSHNPTQSPSNAPTRDPSNAPSFSPSNAPTIAPSESPSISPTQAPTRAPTESNVYTDYIPISYRIANITNDIKSKIARRKRIIIPDIQTIIERGYFDETYLRYSQFHVIVNQITSDSTDYEIDDINNNTFKFWGDSLILKGRIECGYADCVFITKIDMTTSTSRRLIEETNENCNSLTTFQAITKCNLGTYFGRSGISFTANNNEPLSEESVICLTNCEGATPVDYALYSLIAVVAFIFIIAILALLFNKRKFPKLPGFNVVDDAKWTALLIFGLQLWDFC